MATEPSKNQLNEFPLRLMPSVRQMAERFSEREGVSLNQFINVAVAEKLAHLKHEEWARCRSKVDESRTATALAILDRAGSEAPSTGDELPKGYRSVRETYVAE